MRDIYLVFLSNSITKITANFCKDAYRSIEGKDYKCKENEDYAVVPAPSWDNCMGRCLMDEKCWAVNFSGGKCAKIKSNCVVLEQSEGKSYGFLSNSKFPIYERGEYNQCFFFCFVLKYASNGEVLTTLILIIKE